MQPRRPGRRPSRLAALAPQDDGQYSSFSRRNCIRALPTTTPKIAASGKKREAERRKAHPTNFRAAPANVAACQCPGAEARQSGRARLPALHRGSRQDLIPAQLQAMLPGIWFRRALPALACPSPVEAPHTSAVVPKRMMPKAAPARTANPRGSTALAPLPKVPSRRRPSMSEICQP